MIEHNNKVHLPLFYLFILIWLSISKRWLSNIFFTPISCKHSQLNKNLLTPLPLPANTLIFLLSEQNALLELLIIMSPIFISPIFSSTYPSFWPFLLCYWKTINIKVSNDWWLLNPMISSYTWSYLTCQKHLTQLISSLISRINPWESPRMVPSLCLNLLISDWPSSRWQLHPSGSSAQKHLGFSLVIFDSLFTSIPHIQSSKKSYWLHLCHPVSHHFSPLCPQPLSSFLWVTPVAS